jgi:cytoskeletal protein RodZ
MSNESTINFVFVSRLNDGAAEIRIETNSRTALQDALVHLGLASSSQFGSTLGAAIPNPAVNEAVQGTVAEQTAKAKPKSAKKPQAEATVAAAAEAEAEAPAQVAEAEVQAPAELVEQAAAEVAAPVQAVAKATVEEAAAAVRAYGAKHGLDAARALLQRHGFARTTEVTADKAGDIVAEAAL